MDMLTDFIVVIIHNIYINLNMVLYTLHIKNFYLSIETSIEQEIFKK